MSQDTVSIEIDGRSLEARKGTMIIEVADRAGIHIPRFCYHEKLSVAANCRMCLVDVERAPKPLPACATPIMDGMKISTRSRRAVEAQKATMAFLLINHPLDCPICDQGGECELQDVAMGYGSGVSRFSERKRAVVDKDIGPLVATEMTRCIHCTRCVRFGDEIAGLRELGATGRGEHVEIGTYVEHAMVSELSGNVIDLCPVGALTAKPSRFKARAWEMVQYPGVAPHDAVGSNTFMHTLRNHVVRVVPRDNEEINEVWLSDRDRFSYQGLEADDRALNPSVRGPDGIAEVEWEPALERAVEGLRSVLDTHGPDAVGVLAGPCATVEELYLLQKLARGLGISNIDHRLRQADFSDQDDAPAFPWLGMSLADLETVDAALLVASNIRHEQPLAGHRLRKAALAGAQINFINGRRYDFRFPLAGQRVVPHGDMVAALGRLAVAVSALTETALPKSFQGVAELAPDDEDRALAARLRRAERGVVLLGSQTVLHPELAKLRLLASWIARTTECRFGYLPEAGSTVGGWMSGALPHRLPGGVASEATGANAVEMIRRPRKAYILLGVEPEFDMADPVAALGVFAGAECVVSLTSFTSAATAARSAVTLPVAAPGETAGTYINAEGRWQSVQGAVKPPGEARPAWKVLRVLGNLFGLDGFGYTSPVEITDEVYALCEQVEPDNGLRLGRRFKMVQTQGLQRGGDLPIYAVDALVRRAEALQRTPLAESACVRLSPATAQRLALREADSARVEQNGAVASLPVVYDPGVPDDCVWIPVGVAGSELLGPAVGAVHIEPDPQAGADKGDIMAAELG